MEDNYKESISYTDMIDHVTKALKIRRVKAEKIGTIIKAVFMITTVILVYSLLFVWEENYLLAALLAVIGSAIVFLIDWIVKLSGRNRVLYETLYADGVTLFNQEQDYNFTHKYKPKFNKEFNKEMGLFTRYASISGHYEIKAKIDDFEVTIKRIRIITSTGNSTTLHFDGVYLIFPVKNIPIQQYRTNGRPALKGVKMDRLDEYEEKVYIERDHKETDLDRRLETLFHSIPSKFDVRHYYVASNEQEVHIAYWPKKRMKLPKTINYNTVQTVINQLHDILSYTVETMHYLDESNYE